MTRETYIMADDGLVHAIDPDYEPPYIVRCERLTQSLRINGVTARPAFTEILTCLWCAR